MNQEIVRRFLLLFTDVAPGELFSVQELQYIYNCISHSEERGSALRDQWGNWEFPFTSQDYRIPYLDRFVTRRMKERQITPKLLWPGNSRFAFCITHDVDVISMHSPTIKMRRYEKHLENAEGIFDKLRFTQMVYRNQLLKYFKKWEQTDSGYFDFFIESETAFNFRSLFNIFIHSKKIMHKYDCDYYPDDKCMLNGKLRPLGDVLVELNDNNFEVGLHGSYESYNDAAMLQSQKKILEEMCGHSIKSGRQHYLHFDSEVTPGVLTQSGINVDTSLGFNRTIGFRAGTSMPYFLNEKLLEVPMHIMDCALFRNDSMGLSPEAAKQFIIKYFDYVEEAGGCLCINYHSDAFRFPETRESYLFCIEEAAKRNACNMVPTEIYEHIQKVISI